MPGCFGFLGGCLTAAAGPKKKKRKGETSKPEQFCIGEEDAEEEAPPGCRPTSSLCALAETAAAPASGGGGASAGGGSCGGLPPLEDACREARGSCRGRVALARRRLQVAARLLPVAICCAADLSRRRPRRAVANTRRLRVALEALGPAFVKLGQCAASREDVLGDEITAELRHLCDEVAPFPDEEAYRLVQAELGYRAPPRLGDVVAAASLGQVYRITVDGRQYAMKVQRPGLPRALAMDLVILKGMARTARRLVRWCCESPVDPVAVVEAWSLTFWDELDYNKEAASSENMRRALCGRGGIAGLVIPCVNFDLTSLRVLTTDWVQGFKVTEHPKVVRAEHISIGVETFAAMVLEVGVVHADPHAGNMIIPEDGKQVCLLDFGMVISVPLAHRKAWAKCVVHLVRKEHDAVLDDLIELGFFPRDCPRDEIMPVMTQIWAQLVDCGSDIHKRKHAAQQLYTEILTLVRRFRFNLPDYYVALVRAILTLEGISLAADCNFDIFKAIFPVCWRFMTSADSAVVGKALAADVSRRASGAVLGGLRSRLGGLRSTDAVAVAAATLALGWLAWAEASGAAS